ncbi:CPK16 [Symbiodinium natans]|uniref:CPK16 protein n=1 Tax=Symbiodinium natans TaxID=878477 RepID=A0A812NA74_9DINO|nr:CPK16 [Symbiodinium natans]
MATTATTTTIGWKIRQAGHGKTGTPGVAQGLLPSKRDCYLLAQTVLRGFASWFCSRPAWTVGEASATLRKRYIKIQESYDGVAVINRGCIEDYFTEGGHLGRGGFGTVCRVEPTGHGLSQFKPLSPGIAYAMKKVKLPNRDPELESLSKSFVNVPMSRMLEFLQALGEERATREHVTRNLLRVLDMPQSMYIVMNLLEGPTLQGWMTALKTAVPERTCADLAQQMLSAVHYLHRVAGAVHRDVKPDNFGFVRAVRNIDQPGNVQLFDMGLAWVLPEKIQESSATDLHDVAPGGTLRWLSPEAWCGLCGACSDVWGVGLIVHTLLVGDMPFGLRKLEEEVQVRNAVFKSKLNLSTSIWRRVSAQARKFVDQLLAKDVAARATTTAALRHSFIREENVPPSWSSRVCTENVPPSPQSPKVCTQQCGGFPRVGRRSLYFHAVD